MITRFHTKKLPRVVTLHLLGHLDNYGEERCNKSEEKTRKITKKGKGEAVSRIAFHRGVIIQGSGRD
ncbi:hypothetical protein Pmani_016907 [Petrolisthes manimaculis]|uniref:Uncharacterized protein n=1 Tax=Petrolisthes manimaculis TaxID=1843537 RepID=A0AAE1PQR6_9EUCA|nr:hypothetical protein Pmani_016907 [Petrolisthes manimaculis]